MARRLEPTVLLAAISPITIALVAGAVALTFLLSGSLIAAIVVGIAVYVLRLQRGVRKLVGQSVHVHLRARLPRPARLAGAVPGKLRSEVNNSPTHADGLMDRDSNANSKASMPPTLAAVGWRPSSPPTAASPNARNAHETSLSRSTCGSMKQWPG